MIFSISCVLGSIDGVSLWFGRCNTRSEHGPSSIACSWGSVSRDTQPWEGATVLKQFSDTQPVERFRHNAGSFLKITKCLGYKYSP